MDSFKWHWIEDDDDNDDEEDEWTHKCMDKCNELMDGWMDG